MTPLASAPRVSVCIPVRDGERYLGGALASALAQRVDGLEVLVHDDASTDGCAGVVASFADPRVRYLRHAAPLGVAANRDSCLASARGECISWLDADDELLPGALARHLAVLDAHPDVVLVHAAHDVIDEDGRALRSWPSPLQRDAIEPSAVAFGHLISANEMATSTVMARRCALRDAGPFATDIGASSSDWDMWLRLALRGAVAYCAQPAARYRQHPRSISRATTAGGERLRCNVRVVERVLQAEQARIPDPARARAVADAALAGQALLHAGESHTAGRAVAALASVALAGQLAPSVAIHDLLGATERGDDAACLRLTQAAFAQLADLLEGTRFGAKLRRAAARDQAWDAQLARAGAAAARATPPGAVLAVIAKWDPALLDRSGRAGCNFPDRRLLPDGYPRDGAAAVAHLEALRAVRGVTHVVVPAVSDWWLDHYRELALALGAPLLRNEDVAIFALDASS